MTEFTRTTKQANCEACHLGTAMKDCPACKFHIEYQNATSADVYRMWKRLWGNRTPEQVAFYSDMTDGEQYDQTQLTDKE